MPARAGDRGRRRYHPALGAALLLGALSCARPAPPPAADAPRTLDPAESLAAFARLYGVVRWFHPSDEAAGASWDAVAVEGVELALDARSPEALSDGLSALFLPLAPTLQLWTEGGVAPPPRVLPGEGPRLAWQHFGWSFGGDQPVFRADRLGREAGPVGTAIGVTATNGDVADGLGGRRIRVTAQARADGPADGTLWLRVDRGPRAEPGPRVEVAIDDADWRAYTVELDLPADATWWVFGLAARGRGTLWADDTRADVLEPDGSWRPLPVRDAGFEDRERWWVIDGLGHDAAVVDEQGDAVLRLRHQDLARGAVRDEAPALGDAWEGPLGAGLVARVPLALPFTPVHPVVDALPAIPADRDDVAVRVAAAITAWNVLRHFHPYGPDLGVDWDAALDRAVAGALSAPDQAALVDVLWDLLGDVPDGHGWVAHPIATPRACGLALRWVRVGDALVVTHSVEPDVVAGDVVVAVDDQPTAEALAAARRHVSGSSQFRDAFAAVRLATRTCGSVSALRLQRGGARVDVSVRHQGGEPATFDHPGIEWTPDGIAVVDLNEVAWTELEPALPELAGATGLVFDLREYPAAGDARLLDHLLVAPDETRGWLQVPRITRPGEIAGWERHAWGLRPREPHLAAPTVFLTSPLAISAAESVLGLVRVHHLGTLVGEPTAGTNGNATGARLPGGYRMQFTGMRVVQPDGTPLHLVGIAPDVPVAPTRAGLVAGRDEVRDAAIAWLRTAGR